MFYSLMHYALQEAYAAYDEDEVPVGAVIAERETGRIIASAHNRMRQMADPTAHAEMLAIREACRVKQTSRLEDCDMYVTLEPCPMCAQAIAFAHIGRLYFAAYDPKGGGVEHGPCIFHSSSCHHRPELYGGIREREAAMLLKRFFAGKRVGFPTGC